MNRRIDVGCRYENLRTTCSYRRFSRPLSRRFFGVVVEPGSLRTGRIWNWAPPLSRSSLSIEARYAQFLFMLLDGWESLFSSPRRPVH